jgi:hypothetical protein
MPWAIVHFSRVSPAGAVNPTVLIPCQKRLEKWWMRRYCETCPTCPSRLPPSRFFRLSASATTAEKVMLVMGAYRNVRPSVAGRPISDAAPAIESEGVLSNNSDYSPAPNQSTVGNPPRIIPVSKYGDIVGGAGKGSRVDFNAISNQLAGDLINGSLKRSPSYAGELVNHTVEALLKLSRGSGAGATKAAKMLN